MQRNKSSSSRLGEGIWVEWIVAREHSAKRADQSWILPLARRKRKKSVVAGSFLFNNNLDALSFLLVDSVDSCRVKSIISELYIWLLAR